MDEKRLVACTESDRFGARTRYSRAMKLYVCWGTFQTNKGHPCANAYEALTGAGHTPTIVRTGGCYRTDPLFPGRRAVKRMTGNYKVPTLELDDGTVIDGSENIVDWAHSNRVASL